MTGALTNFSQSGALANMDMNTMSQALLEDTADDQLPADGQFINFSGKLGQYMVGQAREDLDPEAVFAVNSLSLARGWCCWKGGKPVARHRWSVYDKASAVLEDDLEDHGPYNNNSGEGWKKERLFSVKGLDNDIEGTFTTSSVSGCNSVAELQVKIRKQAAAEEPIFPIITFGMVEFEAQGNKNFKPVFEVVAWTSQEALSAFEEGKLTVEDLINGKQPRQRRVTAKKTAKRSRR